MNVERVIGVGRLYAVNARATLLRDEYLNLTWLQGPFCLHLSSIESVALSKGQRPLRSGIMQDNPAFNARNSILSEDSFTRLWNFQLTEDFTEHSW